MYGLWWVVLSIEQVLLAWVLLKSIRVWVNEHGTRSLLLLQNIWTLIVGFSLDVLCILDHLVSRNKHTTLNHDVAVNQFYSNITCLSVWVNLQPKFSPSRAMMCPLAPPTLAGQVETLLLALLQPRSCCRSSAPHNGHKYHLAREPHARRARGPPQATRRHSVAHRSFCVR